MRTLLVLFIGLTAGLLLSGCSGKSSKITRKGVVHEFYDCNFPDKDASSDLEKLTRSVCKVYSVATYKTYYFKPGLHIIKKNLTPEILESGSFGITTSTETTSGTATLIFRSMDKLTLVTCAHVVSSPDTLITWFKSLPQETDPVISSISIKVKQELFIREFGVCGKLDLLSMDQENDVAFLGKECLNPDPSLEIFSYPAGNTRQLRWGSFVYILGYPMGSLMVTRGIVSKPKKEEDTFMVDALFNKGFSGGILVAIRGGIPNFEWVGMIRSVPSQKEYYLRPEKEAHEAGYDAHASYTGELFVGTHEAISYGVTTVVPVEKIRDLYLKNRTSMKTAGYNLDGVFMIGD